MVSMNNMRMIYCILVLLDILNQCLSIKYVNDTINVAQIMNEDFHIFQRTGRKTGGRDSRRLFSFDTRNDNIEVGIEFSVPFLTIPVKRSLNTMKNAAGSATTATSTFIRDPIANINTGAVGLTGLVVAAGIAATYVIKAFWSDQAMFAAYRPSQYRSDYSKINGNGIPNTVDNEDHLTKLVFTIEKTLQKYNIDATACTQRTLCTSVRDAARNVANGIGTSSEKILDGITSASWLERWTAGTAINDAISVGRFSSNCEQKYSGCKLKLKSFEQVFETVLRSLSQT